MSLKDLLAPPEIEAFIRDYFQVRPFSKTGSVAAANRLISWESFKELFLTPGADVLIVRKNERFAGPFPQSAAEVDELSKSGYTLVVRHAEGISTTLNEFARGFADEFASVVDVQLYGTPENQFGFAWHYDAEEVFLIQVDGRKEYSLRKNTVNPWPVEETLPQDMRYEREIMPLMKCLLEPGDWLYVPSGYWHYGTSAEPSLTMAVGLAPRTGMDVYDQLRPLLLESLRWRQRLPVMGTQAILTKEQLCDAVGNLSKELAADFLKLATSPKFIESFLSQMNQLSPANLPITTSSNQPPAATEQKD